MERDILENISLSVQNGYTSKVKEGVQQALDAKIAARDILRDGLIAGMDIVSERMNKNEIFVPEVLIASRALSKGMEILRPFLNVEGEEKTGVVVLGTVRGDLHDIGKNLVRTMMEGKNLRVVDLGMDVPTERFVEAGMEYQAEVIACSALLTTTIEELRLIVHAVHESPLGTSVKIMVGGAPVTQAFADEIGADCYTANAAAAAEAAVKLCAAVRAAKKQHC